ncbi:IS110 family transposase [Nocardia takedensis]|uniref:IS110 family transposase n=1 Tax=Nocardia takedensis TaxID=259390 RepID=UPI0002E25141|nr:transposase [Nocardia takedensis]
MVVIGLDLHKSSHTATVVDPATNSDLGSVRIDATLAVYRRLIAWVERRPQRRWAVENADGLGRHLSRWLTALGEIVLDVPTTATARVRAVSRGGRRKNDRIDAAAAARVAALQGDARPARSFPTNTATHYERETNAETICPRVELAWSTSSTPCCETPLRGHPPCG